MQAKTLGTTVAPFVTVREAELLPGTWVQIDVVGVTQDGTHVDGVHPRFAVGEDLQLGYFAYRFDPDAPVRTLTVEALGRRMQTTFRGSS